MSSRLIFPILFCALTAPVSAANSSYSPEAAVAVAVKQNPTIAVARLRLEEARGRLQQSGRLVNPELELEMTRHTAGRESAVGASFIQKFPLTARLTHEKAVSKAEVKAAEAEIADAERRLVIAVKTAFVKKLALNEQLVLREKQRVQIQELVDFLKGRVEKGEAAAVDVSQAELEGGQVDAEKLQLLAEEQEIGAELKTLLGLKPDAPLQIKGDLGMRLWPVPPSGSGKQPRADVQVALARAEAAAATARQQRASRLEDIGAGVGYSRERSLDKPDPLETEQLWTLKVTVPLPLWNRNEGRIRESEAAANRSALEAQVLSEGVESETAGARRQMDTFAKLVTELEAHLLPKAAQIEEQLQANYKAGLIPLTDVLRARARRIELERQRIEALRDKQLAGIRAASVHSNSKPSLK